MPLRVRYVCDSCGRDVSPGERCRCGSTDRRRVDPGDVFRRPGTEDGPRWDPLKDWTAKYLQLTWNVAQLRRLVGPGSEASEPEIRQIAELTFASSSSLGDWLTAGPEPVAVTPGDVERLLAAEPLCAGAALGGRTRTGTARLVPVGFARPPRFWVEYRRPNAKPVRYDALDLADRCLVAWQVFLTTRGVPLPTWRP